MPDLVYALLSHSWSGLLLAAPVLLLGAFLRIGSRASMRPLRRVAGVVVGLAGLVLSTGVIAAARTTGAGAH